MTLTTGKEGGCCGRGRDIPPRGETFLKPILETSFNGGGRPSFLFVLNGHHEHKGLSYARLPKYSETGTKPEQLEPLILLDSLTINHGLVPIIYHYRKLFLYIQSIESINNYYIYHTKQI